MNSKLTINILVTLILLVFPISMVGSVYSYTWCFGEDGDAKVEIATINGCFDNGGNCSSAELPGRQSFSKAEQRQCSPCSDLFIEKSDAAVFKRSIKVAKVTFENIHSPVWSLTKVQPVGVPVTTLTLPRISKSILEQRTVVLLN